MPSKQITKATQCRLQTATGPRCRNMTSNANGDCGKHASMPGSKNHMMDMPSTSLSDDSCSPKIDHGYGWGGWMVSCACGWQEVHDGHNSRRRAHARLAAHLGTGPEVDDWGDTFGIEKERTGVPSTQCSPITNEAAGEDRWIVGCACGWEETHGGPDNHWQALMRLEGHMNIAAEKGHKKIVEEESEQMFYDNHALLDGVRSVMDKPRSPSWTRIQTIYDMIRGYAGDELDARRSSTDVSTH